MAVVIFVNFILVLLPGAWGGATDGFIDHRYTIKTAIAVLVCGSQRIVKSLSRLALCHLGHVLDMSHSICIIWPQESN